MSRRCLRSNFNPVWRETQRIRSFSIIYSVSFYPLFNCRPWTFRFRGLKTRKGPRRTVGIEKTCRLLAVFLASGCRRRIFGDELKPGHSFWTTVYPVLLGPILSSFSFFFTPFTRNRVQEKEFRDSCHWVHWTQVFLGVHSQSEFSSGSSIETTHVPRKSLHECSDQGQTVF